MPALRATAGRLLVAALWLAPGCGGSSATTAAPARPGPSRAGVCPAAAVQTDDDAAAMSGCRVIQGDLRIGRSFSLTRLVPLGNIERVSGGLEVSENLGLGGVYLPALTTVDGSLVVEDNRLIDTVAFARLERVGGNLVVRDNLALERVDLGAVVSVGGRLELSGQPRMDSVRLDRLERAGRLVIDGDPAWPAAEIDAVRRRLHP